MGLCKDCKWWENKKEDGVWGKCWCEEIYYYLLEYEGMITHKDFGCRFWVSRKDKDDQDAGKLS